MADRVSRVHAPQYLQSLALGFTNPDLVADILCPVVPVAKQSDKYRVYGKTGVQLHEARWAPGTTPNEIRWAMSEGTYNAKEYKLRTPVTDSEKANADPDMDLEADATELVTNAIQVNREKRVADLFTTAGNYSSGQKITKTGGSEWDQASVVSTDQPLVDLMLLAEKVSKNAMVPISALTVAIPQVVWTTTIWKNAGILARMPGVDKAIVTPDLLRAIIGVKQVVMTAAQIITGPEIADADVVTGYTPTYLWGDNVWIGLVNPAPNQNAMTFARSYNWRAATGGQQLQIRTYRDGDEGKETSWTEAKQAMDERITYADAGGLIINTLSTI